WRTELPEAAVRDTHRMLSDLHLNSISVGQLVSEAAKRLGLPRIVGVTEFANSSVAEVAQALDELQRTGATARTDDKRRQPPGVDSWVEPFTVELVEAPLNARNGRGTTVVNGNKPGISSARHKAIGGNGTNGPFPGW